MLSNHESKNDNSSSAIKIQKHFRGFIARKKFAIKHISEEKSESYSTFIVGNDPFMPPELDNYHEPKDKIALIGTSGMRAVSLACKLGNPTNIPKIIIIDNSKEVYKFWYQMREFVADNSKAGNQDLFLKNLPTFLAQNKNLYRDISPLAYQSDASKDGKVKYLNQDANVYFSGLIKKYGYDYMRAVIVNTSLIRQTWADSDTFFKIKNILSYLNIKKVFMYPSNIVSGMTDIPTIIKILKNIESFKPAMSIHTNTCDDHSHPEKVFLQEDNSAAKVVMNALQRDCYKRK